MRMFSCQYLSPLNRDWDSWKITKGKLITPDGWSLTSDRHG
ncbi:MULTISPECIES: DUF3653 domain-containing protein [Photobacterium]|nr:DUF3653 domain-containing protein [Photobacterium carnosum]MCD9498806.1 hypothetical protein [Photobacterium carnosum]MCD9521444.1 hypothetical protein [Photobacterium carnosum]MCD9537182.1 hypothetical protein [Photobacterium carnosum]MCD9555553.1 hypothetical protein [Photobacterium carnosum]MCF2161727.1 hypothetical protein [Photobacterium carnosum]